MASNLLIFLRSSYHSTAKFRGRASHDFEGHVPLPRPQRGTTTALRPRVQARTTGGNLRADNNNYTMHPSGDTSERTSASGHFIFLYLSETRTLVSETKVWDLINMQNVSKHVSDRSSHFKGKRRKMRKISAFGPWTVAVIIPPLCSVKRKLKSFGLILWS